jgi:D-aminoacyl-tRNA deacylase
MRAIIQRVISGSVTVNGVKISSIKKGLLVLVGITKADTKADRDWLIRKLINIRLWPDENGKPWNKSIKDLSYELLLVSQFTLYATMKGIKPQFSEQC